MTHLKYLFTSNITMSLATSHDQDHRQARRRLQCRHKQGELLLKFCLRFDDSEPAVQPFRVSIRTGRFTHFSLFELYVSIGMYCKP
jgi:hypothetical protein